MHSPTNEVKSEKDELADSLSNLILGKLLEDLHQEIEIMVPRTELMSNTREGLKFYEKKGIRTDLFAIERYVDEVLDDVKSKRPDFMDEIAKPVTKNKLEMLFQMQNSEIGSYEHF